MYSCPVCHGTDTNFRSYGIDPEFVLVACFDCARVYIMSFRHLQVILDG